VVDRGTDVVVVDHSVEVVVRGVVLLQCAVYRSTVHLRLQMA